MKLLVSSLVLGFLLGAYCANIREGKTKVGSFIEEKCNKNAHNDDAFNELLAAGLDLPNCMEIAVGGGQLPNPIEDYTQYCQVIREGGYYKCLENLAQKMAPCLDQDEAYFPNFLLTSFNASYEEFCGENGFTVIGEVINDIESSSCIRDSLSLETLQKRCVENLVLYKNYESNIFTIRKKDLCNDLQSAKGCIIQLLQEYCNEDHSTTVNFVFDPYLSPCT